MKDWASKNLSNAAGIVLFTALLWKLSQMTADKPEAEGRTEIHLQAVNDFHFYLEYE